MANQEFYTISIWRDDAALDAFAATPPHRQLMAELAPEMNGPRFVRWAMSGDEGIPRWADVLDRLR